MIGPEDAAVLRRYLLGTLSAEEQVGLEERLLAEDALFQELVLLEEDLVDEYVSGELADAEREQLPGDFAMAPERRQAIELAQGLRRRAGKPKAAARTFPSRRLSLRWGTAAAAALLLALSGAVVVSWQRAAGLERELAQARSAQARQQGEAAEQERALRAANAQLAQRLEEERSLVDALKRGRPGSPAPGNLQPAPPPSPLPVSAFLRLAAGAPRDQTRLPRLRLPGHESRVGFALALDVDAPGPYFAELIDPAGRWVWRSGELPASQGTVSVHVPSGRFAAGDFRILLSRVGDQGPETVGTYLFRVVPEGYGA